MIEPIPVEGEKNKQIKEKINEIIAYLNETESAVPVLRFGGDIPEIYKKLTVDSRKPEWSQSYLEPEEDFPVGTVKPKVNADGTVSEEFLLIKAERGWNLVKREEYDEHNALHSRETDSRIPISEADPEQPQ